MVRSWGHLKVGLTGDLEEAFGVSSWVAGVTTCRPGERREEKTRISGLEYIKYESIQGEIPNQQLDLPAWSSGKRSTRRYKFRSHWDMDGISSQETGRDHLGESPGQGSRLGTVPWDAPTS